MPWNALPLEFPFVDIYYLMSFLFERWLFSFFFCAPMLITPPLPSPCRCGGILGRSTFNIHVCDWKPFIVSHAILFACLGANGFWCEFFFFLNYFAFEMLLLLQLQTLVGCFCLPAECSEAAGPLPKEGPQPSNMLCPSHISCLLTSFSLCHTWLHRYAQDELFGDLILEKGFFRILQALFYSFLGFLCWWGVSGFLWDLHVFLEDCRIFLPITTYF